jgi:hypothetical protein
MRVLHVHIMQFVGCMYLGSIQCMCCMSHTLHVAVCPCVAYSACAVCKSCTCIIQSMPIIVICLMHGQFQTMPGAHLRSAHGGADCARTSPGANLTSKEFIEHSQSVHNRKYTSERSVYVRQHVMVAITCRKHGDFDQWPNSDMMGHRCKECDRERK